MSKQVIFINSDGLISQQDGVDIVAKCNINPFTETKNYYIRFENSHMVDPVNRDFRRHFTEQAQWKRVSEQVYNLYVKFLKTNKQAFLSKAKREYHD